MLYLELGILPIRFIIKMRRLNFLQYILHEEKKSLVHSFLKCQLSKPTRGDWGQACLATLESIEIDLEIGEIEDMKKVSFNSLVRKKTALKAFEELNAVKSRRSKVLHIVHKKLEIQRYLEGGELSTLEGKFMFALRSRMLELKENYRGKFWDNIFPCCHEHEDTQEHLLDCEILNSKNSMVSSLPVYHDLFSGKLEKQVQVCRILKHRLNLRKKLTTSNSGPCDPYFLWSAVAMFY